MKRIWFIFVLLSYFLQQYHSMKICWVTSLPSKHSCGQGSGAQGRGYCGHQEGVTVVPLHPPHFRVWLLQDMCSLCLSRDLLFRNHHQTVRALPRSSPREPERGNVCSGLSWAKCFLGKTMGKPPSLGCDFPCNCLSDIYRHEQPLVRIHSVGLYTVQLL